MADQHYSNPDRESDPHALPDVEVFYRTKKANAQDGWTDGDGDPLDEGWFYWFCFPGCMPDSDAMGPYATEWEAINAAREAVE